MTAGILPVVDKQLLHIETWLHRELAELLRDGDGDHVRLLRQFAMWHQLPRLRKRAEQRPLTVAVRRFAGEQVTQARLFLVWLAAHNSTLAAVSQDEIDSRHATHRDHEKRGARVFLTWAIKAGHTPKRQLPLLQQRRNEPITQHRRLALLRHVLDDDHGPLRSKVAACLILLYSQPVAVS